VNNCRGFNRESYEQTRASTSRTRMEPNKNGCYCPSVWLFQGNLIFYKSAIKRPDCYNTTEGYPAESYPTEGYPAVGYPTED
jgi:hypothetical protein